MDTRAASQERSSDAVHVDNAASPSAAPPLPAPTAEQPVRERKITPLTWRHYLTHFPKHPQCKTCQRCKVQRAMCKRVKEETDHSMPLPVAFGDAITCDWAVLTDRHKARNDEVDCLLNLDRATHWKSSWAACSRAHEEVIRAFEKMLGPGVPSPKFVYSDNAPEFKKAFRLMHFLSDTSCPHRPATNGVVERAMRTLKEGTACLLSQAGLQPDWWVEAADCFLFLSNIVDPIPSGEFKGMVPYQARFNEDCKAKLVNRLR